MPQQQQMKTRVAHTIKWNLIDKVATTLLYTVTGVVLARVLSQADFGLIGAIMVFQGFAALFVDSGFSSALIQRKNPTHLDYSTVLWFNIAMALGLYIVLYFAAPFIAWCFQGDERLIPLSRVMFLTFILNATAIVQTNRLMKRMDVKMVAISDALGLVVGGVVGIWMALAGYGAWALVWQYIVIAAVKSAVLWLTGDWFPMMRFSWSSLKSFFAVGSGVMGVSFLNTVFQNIYSFFIGNRVGIVPLGYYSQADKWSKMPVSSFSAVLTSSFLPALSECQDDRDRFIRATAKMNRFTSYLILPLIVLMIVAATPIFHTVLGTKWDASIPLFQLLLVRGAFVVFTSLYTQYILALGHAKLLVYTEIFRDVVALVAIIATLPFIALTAQGDVVYGIKIFLYGQVLASALAWFVTLVVAARKAGREWIRYMADCLPYLVQALAIGALMIFISQFVVNELVLLAIECFGGAALYIGVNYLFNSKMQREAFAFVLRRS